ncbi:hypothetical protein F5887DRAFT_1061262 [Amanita rubescens]|nr:hypothetical protein F5887DRAFT_1061262 [Amanita rubescens]
MYCFQKNHPSLREHHLRLSALSNFSIGDLFGDFRDGSKSVKFPEKLKVLKNIITSNYSDQLVRRTMAKFYGQFLDDSFKKQMKENRKIEELILMFATHATAVLKKEPALALDGWKMELNNHIAQFVKMFGECLRDEPSKLTPKSSSSAYSDSGYDSASTSRDRDSYVGSSLTVPPASGLSVADMRLEQAIQKEVDQIKGTVTEKAINDLKTCLKNINAGAAFPGRREDFDSDTGWQHWRSLETSVLQQLMVAMVQAKPELAKTTSDSTSPTSGSGRPGSIYGPSGIDSPIECTTSRTASVKRSMYNSLEFTHSSGMEDSDDDPRKYYKRLLELCLQEDLDKMLSPDVPDNEEVSLGILTQPHLDLLSEWHAYRAVCFLDLVKDFFERESIPIQTVGDTDVDNLMVQDYEYLSNVYGALFTLFMSYLYHSMDQLPSLKPSFIEHFLTILDHVTDSGLLDKFNLDVVARFEDIRDHARQMSAAWYDAKMDGIVKENHGVNQALPLLMMTDEIKKSQKLIGKRFPDPVLGQLDFASLFAHVFVPRFINDLSSSQKRLYESSMNGPTPDVPIQDIFSLYRRTKMLIEIHDAFCPQVDLQFDLGVFFEPYVRQWLVTTDNRTSQWVEAFEPDGEQGHHSTSIADLFDSLRSPINILQELHWADEYQEARFFTSLSNSISKAIDIYCRTVESLFLAEMFPRPNDHLQPQKSSAWLEKARQLAVTGEKRVEPFNFRPETCVKLNNVEAARKLLDNMYNQMQADHVAVVLEHSAPPVPEKVVRGDRFLFTVKVVIAEGLLDTFVTLSDEAGNRLAKTRTIYETTNPRWEEAFDISVEKPLWLMVSVRDRALVGKHDTVGRAYLCLDPRRFGDFLSHELWMDLDSSGRILVRVSMGGEKDDILFFFGRAFRSLKRAEGDMLRIFIDKMSPFIRQCASRNIVKTLLKSRDVGLDYNKVLGNMTAFYKSALGGGSSLGEVQIPLPLSENPCVRPDELTDVEIEQAIVPLFDYFDANLQTLNTYLSETAKVMVMSRVWKVLSVIESLLIPPLSEVSSEMKSLSEKEVDIVFKWLKLESIQNQRYRDVMSIRLYYDWHTDELMEECVKMTQQSLGADSTFVKKRAKSVYSQQNLGTIRRSGSKRKRILRMRPGMSNFISQQIWIMAKMQQEQEKRAKELEQRKSKRASAAPQLPA